jgi:PAS domain S-box-containing protein
MNAKKDHLTEDEARRQKAETQIKRGSTKTGLPTSEADTLKLIHELEVHQIELEMQNEELQLAKKKVEELAKEKYIELYDYSPTGYLSISKNGKILELNHAAAEILGKERLKVINNQFTLFLSDNSLIEFNLFLDRVFATSKKESCDIIIEVDGLKPINVDIEGNISPDGKFCLITMFNITERKQFEKRIIEVSTNWQTTFDAIDDIIILLTPTFDIIEINKAGLLMQHKTREEVIGEKCYRIFHGTDAPICSCPCQIALTEKKYIKNEYTFGEQVCELIAFPIIDGNNQVQAFTHIIRNITEHKELENSLMKAKEKAEESDHLKSAFLANMSHEIRTPMNGILGFADLLKEPQLSGEEQLEYINIIEKSGIRMLNIINNIIDIAKIESGEVKTSIFETNINEQLDFILNFFKPEAEKKGLSLILKSTLSDDKSIIKTDSEKVYAILTNLIKNAIKFTDEGSIELGCEINGEFLQFDIKDTGVGIPEDRQKAIFERFVQADITDKRAFQGAGLGLAITKVFVEVLGGKIWFESAAKKGSVFHFTLPYNNETEVKNTSRNEIATKSALPVKPLKVLVVEDDDISDLYITKLLTKYNCELLLHAKTGAEAIKACRNNPDLDLVLMDMKMPDINGHEATRLIREFAKEVVMIAQTAYALSGNKELAIEAGCNDYITKPISQESLNKIILKYFAK